MSCVLYKMGQASTNCYNNLDKMWSKILDRLCGKVPAVFQIYQPFCSLSVTLFMIIQFFWTFIIIDNDLANTLNFNSSRIVSILTGTLGFILPLRLNSALKKNRACLDNYNAFVGDLISFSWEVIAFNRLKPDDKQSRYIVSNMFDILIAIPALTKWHFRNDVKLDKLYSKDATANWEKLQNALTMTFSTPPRQKNQKKGVLFLETRGGEEVKNLLLKINRVDNIENIPMNDQSISATDACLYKLLDLSKELASLKKQGSNMDTGLLRAWERAYSSWGNMGNLNSYKQPLLFVAVLWTALAIYSALLPFEFIVFAKNETKWGPAVKGNGYHPLWMVSVIGYFFLGLNVAGSRVGNAFAEDVVGYQTVSESQKAGTRALNGIWRGREEIAVPALPIDAGRTGGERLYTSRLSLF